MNRWFLLSTALFVFLFAVLAGPALRAADGATPALVGEASFEQDVRPLFETYCYACHGSGVKVAGFDLEALVGDYRSSVITDFRRWETVAEQIISGSMPPAGQPTKPTDDQRRFLTAWIDHQLETADLSHLNEPGAPVVRRLNRAEFRNTVRDLTGVDFDVTDYLPADGMSEDGFANNGNSLFLSPSDLEKLVAASEEMFAHAEFSPTKGLLFREEPPEPVLHSQRVHRAASELAGLYDELVREHFEERGEALLRYFSAAWEAKYRHGSDPRFSLTAFAGEQSVQPAILQRLMGYLDLDYQHLLKKSDGVDPEQFGEFRLHFDALFQPFQSLRVPESDADLAERRAQAVEAAERFSKVLATFRQDVDYVYSLAGGDHSHRFEVDVSGRPVVYLLVTDAGDENEYDYAAWLDGAFEFSNGTRRSLADSEMVESVSADDKVARNVNSREDPLHVFVQASFLRTVRTRLYEEPNGMTRDSPLYRDNTIEWEHALAVKAPSLLAFRAPEGAVRFTVTGAMQDISRTRPGEDRRQWFEDGMVQFAVSTQRPATLDFVPGARLTFSNRTQFRQFRKYLEDLVSNYFPSAQRWTQLATEQPGKPLESGVFHLPPEQLAAMLPADRGREREELLRRWEEYFLLSAEPRFVRERIDRALNWERRLIAKDYKDRILTLEETRELAGDEAKAEVAFLDWLLLDGQGRLRSAAGRSLSAFAAKAFRRPVEPREVRQLMSLYDGYMEDERPYVADAVRFAARSVLVSPHFLYLSEEEKAGVETSRLDPYELASRLSYFLWSTRPDEELLRPAAAGRLDDVEVLLSQADRLLRDERSAALADQFFGNWLEFRHIREYDEPNLDLFPEYTDSLREAMYQEALHFAREIIQQDRSILNLVDSDFTYLNEELARHYGIAGVKGPEFRRVTLGDSPRGGVLGMAGVLTLTSHPARTSPVVRGLFVLKNLLGSPPPPPPPNAASRLDASKQSSQGLSFREQLEIHRRDPSCASCHRRLDPLGFALENFDPIGRFRTVDPQSGKAVDTRASLPDGTPLGSLQDVQRALLRGREKKKFVRHFCRQLLAYALSRSLTYQDLDTVRTMERSLAESGYRFSAAVRAVVASRQFRFRPAGGAETDRQAQAFEPGRPRR